MGRRKPFCPTALPGSTTPAWLAGSAWLTQHLPPHPSPPCCLSTLLYKVHPLITTSAYHLPGRVVLATCCYRLLQNGYFESRLSDCTSCWHLRMYTAPKLESSIASAQLMTRAGHVQQCVGLVQVTWGGCSSKPAVVDVASLLLPCWAPLGDCVLGWGRAEVTWRLTWQLPWRCSHLRSTSAGWPPMPPTLQVNTPRSAPCNGLSSSNL